MQTRIMRGNVFEWCIMLSAGSRSGGPILFLKISRKWRAFQGGAALALNHLARRSHRRLTSGHRCWPPMLRQWVSVPGSCHHRRNQPHAVISDDRELVLLRVRSAAPLINSFSAGDLFVRCLVLIHSPSPSRLSSSRICRNCRLCTGSYLICRRISDDEDQIGKSQLFIEINIAVLFEMMIGYNMCATFYCILQVVMLSRCTTIYENFNRVREWLLCAVVNSIENQLTCPR